MVRVRCASHLEMTLVYTQKKGTKVSGSVPFFKRYTLKVLINMYQVQITTSIVHERIQPQ